MKKCFQVSVYGRVQGVWFRASTKEKAEALGISGFVRNQADGSVYAELEGSTETLELMLAWLRRGPPLAQVDRIEVDKQEANNYSGFDIRR